MLNGIVLISFINELRDAGLTCPPRYIVILSTPKKVSNKRVGALIKSAAYKKSY